MRDVLWVLEDWRDATRGRGGGAESGPERLNHERLFYWRTNRGFFVSDWQMTTMLKMDEAYLDELSTPLEDKKEPKNG